MEHPSDGAAEVAKAAAEAKAATMAVGAAESTTAAAEDKSASAVEAKAASTVDLRGKGPLEEDKEEVDLISNSPPLPFDENIINEEEEDSDDVGSDVESRHKKTRATLTKIEKGKYDKHWTRHKLSCPFYKRSIGTDFRNVMMHAESLGSSHVKVGETVNIASFMAKHMAYGIFLRKKHNRAIKLGHVPPPKPKKEKKKKGQGSRKWRRSHRKVQK